MSDFHTPERAKQLISFKSVAFGKDNHLGATDCDGLIEYKDKAYIFFEVKHGDTKCHTGQRIAFERLCKDLAKTGKQVLWILCKHDTPVAQEIILGECIVTQYFYEGRYYSPPNGMKVKDCMKRFILAKVNTGEVFNN